MSDVQGVSEMFLWYCSSCPRDLGKKVPIMSGPEEVGSYILSRDSLLQGCEKSYRE